MRISIFFFIVFISFTFAALPQSYWIDKIQTDEDVNFFIWNNFNSKYPRFSVADTNNIFKLESYKLIADSLKMKYWYKEDFNSDTHADLLAYGSYKQGAYSHPVLLAVIDEGSGIYKLHGLSNVGIRDFGTFFPIIKKNNSEVLLIRYQTLETDSFMINLELNYKMQLSDVEIIRSFISNSDFKIFSDTLVYKYGSFIEYNSVPIKEKITEFRFLNHCGMISCFVMDIRLKPNGEAEVYVGDYYEEKQNYKFNLNDSLVNQIFGLITYIDPSKLRNDYSDLITDDAAVTTFYTNEDGTVKEVYDYGASGTFGLKRLYEIMFEFEHNKTFIK